MTCLSRFAPASDTLCCALGRPFQPFRRQTAVVRAGKPQLACSASGHCVSIVWPHARRYMIWIAVEGGAWTQLTDGVATHLVRRCTRPFTARRAPINTAGARVGPTPLPHSYA